MYRPLLLPLLLLLGLAAGAQTAQRDTMACDSLRWGDTVYRFGASSPNYWTAVTLFDTVAPDSVVRWNARIFTSTHSFDTAVACRRYAWNGIPFLLPDSLRRASYDTFQLGTTLAGCPAYHHMHLTLLATDTTRMDTTVCDQYLWPLTGELLFAPGLYDCLRTNRAGCDSVVRLALDLRFSTVDVYEDSICRGQSLQFYHRTLTASGNYNQNFVSSVAPYCDSIVVLMLTVLPPPPIELEHWVDCYEYQHYVTVHTPVDYIEWCASPADPLVDLYRHSPTLVVNPNETTRYTLTADYLPEGICPNSAEIILKHIHPLQAEMNVIPPQISQEELAFEARDLTLHATGRDWYVDGLWLSSAISFRHEASVAADSVVIMLDAHHDYCHDTARLALRVLSSRTFTPNVFFPDQQENNRFFFPWQGITEFHVNIYNRGGLLVYHSDDLEAAWDGTHLGRPCPPGVYVWTAQFTDNVRPHNPQMLQGTVTLVR